jgi:hypothetical protein
MTTFRYSRGVGVGLIALGLIAQSSVFSAQAAPPSITLEPLSGEREIDSTSVRNIYGRCGSAVVQILGVERDVGYFFTVDSAAGNADVVLIGGGGRKQLSLKPFLSDHNGVACVGRSAKRLLFWSNCSGTACGDEFGFTVVDVMALKIVAGGPNSCSARCASIASGSDLPSRLNR